MQQQNQVLERVQVQVQGQGYVQLLKCLAVEGFDANHHLVQMHLESMILALCRLYLFRDQICFEVQFEV